MFWKQGFFLDFIISEYTKKFKRLVAIAIGIFNSKFTQLLKESI
jgi:hypothetical protein